MFHRLLITVVLLFALVGCTTIQTNTGIDRIYQAVIADTATTAYALNQGGRELNPLGFAGATIGKFVYLYIRTDLTEEERLRYDRVATSLWTGAAASNALQLVVPGSGLFLGLGFGVYVGLSIWTSW
jgi:uncharacterized protein YceK